MSDFAEGQRVMQERIAKRLDALAEEQKSWHNHHSAAVIRAEAAAIRALRFDDPQKVPACPICGIIDQEPFGPDGHKLGADCPHRIR